MKKISKKLKIIIFVATILVVMILAIVIIENVIKENNLENKEYLETISNADSNLIASYIKEGVTIGGITGTMKGGELKRVVIYNGNGNGTWQIKINVKNALPNVYNKLTIDNFGVTNSNSSSSSGAITGRGITFRSYDQQNGILVCDTHGSNTILDDVTVVAWYIE